MINMETARQEAELVLFPAVEELLRKTGRVETSDDSMALEVTLSC